MKLNQAIQDVKTVNLDEMEMVDPQVKDLQIKNKQISFQIPGSKIATFRITLQQT